MEVLNNQITLIEAKIGYTFQNKAILGMAFVHRSFINENRHLVDQHNERLEFLGDSVLGMLIAEYLYKSMPSTSEGVLSDLRARLVEAASCVAFVQKLQVSSFLLLGKGEKMNDGRGRDSILADLFEAIVGAIYLDGGLEATKTFLFSHFSIEIKNIVTHPIRNWKAELQDFSQKKYQKAPIYEVLQEIGPSHSKIFEVCVYIDDKQIGQGSGASKKEAQQAAAANALDRLPELLT